MNLTELIIDKRIFKLLECKKCNQSFISGFNKPLKTYQCYKPQFYCTDCIKEEYSYINEFCSLELNCPNRNKEIILDEADVNNSGCNEVVPIKQLRSHVNACGFQLVSCLHKECYGNYVMRKDLKQHNESYNNKIIQCLLCSEEMKRIDLDNHILEKCSEKSCICSFCLKPYIKKNQEAHLSLCQEVSIQCHLCNENIKRCDINSHYSNFYLHSKQIINNLIINENKNKELKEKNQQLENKIKYLENENEEIMKRLVSMERSFLKFKDSFKNIKKLISKKKGVWYIDNIDSQSMSYGLGSLAFSFKLSYSPYGSYIVSIEFEKYFDSPVLIDCTFNVIKNNSLKGSYIIFK
ncbi:hypothetical protein DICPUDRAFT_80809 [Dictyostelium purpureum]|uniref:TRAF-type domain-containing protein n=1 Tax=Dictyostelium purpureum TaxID=5786 RepID=F0ZRL3_DICPU|nr:uncharacterized protein DICPUDRAFT_80809 [Dictyostelium purpureum]EGC33427.1 hypothetical protein DICPUDRAFT_80809 [Dictyostelium purpureum]|eukprot:XP_003290046.1 hypothetical protein DICPUDRAFT_80809 [Dictyostelium purpureum]